MSKDIEAVLVAGFMAIGKTTYVEPFVKKGYVRLNRDAVGGRLEKLLPMMEKAFGQNKSVVLDNTFITTEQRKPFIDLCKTKRVKCRIILIDGKIEDSQYNACERMMRRYGKIYTPEDFNADDFDKDKDPNLFPPLVLFSARKQFQMPTKAEGFDSVEVVKFKRLPQTPEYKNKAVIFDYDGTLRDTISGGKYPIHPDDIRILSSRKEKLKQLAKEGYRLLGCSNQSGVATGELTYDDAVKCFDKTNKLLGTDIEVRFCPHPPAPIQCYCRKPMPGDLVYFIEKYKLDRNQTIFVGDRTTDKTAATRACVKFEWAEDFFA